MIHGTPPSTVDQRPAALAGCRMDREGQRAEYVAWLREAAARRFGDARAGELAHTIEDVASWMLEVATFPVAADEAPAFYAEPEPLP